jgi:hypothetical protein
LHEFDEVINNRAMKKIFLLVAGLFSIVALTPNVNADSLPLKLVTLSGSVEVEEIVSPTATHARISSLNNARVFQEFEVSTTDYALVIDLNAAGVLELKPKFASAGLPTIQVFILSGTKAVVDTKKASGDVYDNLTSTASGNLFQGLTGVVSGKITFQGTIDSGVVKKFTLSGIAAGRNQNNAGNDTALLTFKLSTGGDFTQKP